jgi:deoxycytidylate deaminase
MIAFAQNNPIKTNAGAYRIGENFNLPKYKEHPFYHAESHIISKLLDSYNTIDSNWSIVVMRINRKGLILGSKPCENCDKLLNAVGLTNIFYSTDYGDFCDSFGATVYSQELTNEYCLV